MWSKMDLKHIYGFPLWEENVFSQFTTHFDELKAIFTHYAKSGGAGAVSANAALTMQSTELGNMCLDIDILTEKFNMTRVINIFRRADQVDDTQKAAAHDHRIIEGEAAKGGDRGLELHEFLEALVALGFYRFNPSFGEVGKNFEAEFDAGQTLATLLDKHVLKNAKKDALAGVKATITDSAEIQEVFKKYASPSYTPLPHLLLSVTTCYLPNRPRGSPSSPSSPPTPSLATTCQVRQTAQKGVEGHQQRPGPDEG